MARLVPVIVLMVFCALAPCPDCRPAAARPIGGTVAIDTPETQPSSRPDAKKAPSVDDEIKALNLKNMNLGTAMKQFESTKLDAKLHDFSSSPKPDFAEARKLGVQIAATAKAVEWKKNRKRNKDPQAFDQFSSDLESAGRKIAEAAGKKDAADLQTASNAALKACSDCHGKFNPK